MSDFEISVIYGVVALLLFGSIIVVRYYANRNPTQNPLPESIRRKIEPAWFLYFDFIPIILFLLLAVDRPTWISTIMLSLWMCYIAISVVWAFRISKIRSSLSGELTTTQSNGIRFDVKRRFVTTGLYFLIGCYLIFSRL